MPISFVTPEMQSPLARLDEIGDIQLTVHFCVYMHNVANWLRFMEQKLSIGS